MLQRMLFVVAVFVTKIAAVLPEAIASSYQIASPSNSISSSSFSSSSASSSSSPSSSSSSNSAVTAFSNALAQAVSTSPLLVQVFGATPPYDTLTGATRQYVLQLANSVGAPEPEKFAQTVADTVQNNFRLFLDPSKHAKLYGNAVGHYLQVTGHLNDGNASALAQQFAGVLTNIALTHEDKANIGPATLTLGLENFLVPFGIWGPNALTILVPQYQQGVSLF